MPSRSPSATSVPAIPWRSARTCGSCAIRSRPSRMCCSRHQADRRRRFSDFRGDQAAGNLRRADARASIRSRPAMVCPGRMSKGRSDFPRASSRCSSPLGRHGMCLSNLIRSGSPPGSGGGVSGYVLGGRRAYRPAGSIGGTDIWWDERIIRIWDGGAAHPGRSRRSGRGCAQNDRFRSWATLAGDAGAPLFPVEPRPDERRPRALSKRRRTDRFGPRPALRSSDDLAEVTAPWRRPCQWAWRGICGWEPVLPTTDRKMRSGNSIGARRRRSRLAIGRALLSREFKLDGYPVARR